MATEVVCESRIESVTVYARGAVVRRLVALPEALPDGACDVVLRGVTALADVGTLRASLDGGREVLGVRAKLVVPAPAAVDESLAGKVDELRRKRDELVVARNHAGWRRDLLASVHPEPELVRRVIAIDPAARMADALAIVDLVASEMAALDAKIAELSDAIEKTERAVEVLRVAAAQASAAQSRANAPPELSVFVQLGPSKGAGAPSGLVVEYAAAAARWWPTYRARFTDGATRVAVTLAGLVAQATGEDWTGVRLVLSTGDLLRDARLPELTSLRLGRSQKPRARGYRPPPEGLDAMFEGYDRFTAEVSLTVRTMVTSVATATATIEAQNAPRWSRDGGPPPMYPQEFGSHDDDMDEPTAVAMSLAEMPKAKRGGRPRPAAGAPPMPPAAPGFAPPLEARSLAPMQDMPARAGNIVTRSGGGGGRAEKDASVMYSLGGLAKLEDTGAGAASTEVELLPIEPADAWLDFDTLRLDPMAQRHRRGRLVRDAGLSTARSEAAVAAIERMEPPAGTIDPRASRGLFDAVYTAAGTADVPASGKPQRVTIAIADATAVPQFVAVPREAAEVYRRADVKNPFGVPLLTGPVEVLIDGALVALTRLSYTDRGGPMAIGLGVEDRVRVARNTRVDEGTAGLLGGSTTVEHTVTTDLSSSLGRAIRVEIIDRIPVSDEKDVEIKVLASQPQGTPYTQAELGHAVRKGLKWEVEVPAGGKARVEWRYRVTLPSKMEIVGGNRRE